MLREGAQRLIGEALQVGFEEFLSQFADRRDGQGRAAVVRNGWQPRGAGCSRAWGRWVSRC
jgi:putative transposase